MPSHADRVRRHYELEDVPPSEMDLDSLDLPLPEGDDPGVDTDAHAEDPDLDDE